MEVLCADVLVAVFRLLPPRSLAVSRCVCTSWRATIDDHRLLRRDMLPLSLDGVFFSTIDLLSAPMLFSRSSTRLSITSRLDYVDNQNRFSPHFCLIDCCNGLLLLDKHVVNPATRQSVRLPAYPPPCVVPGCTSCIGDRDECLVYDPTESRHYKVLLIPHIPGQQPSGHISKYTPTHSVSGGGGPPLAAMEWPPSPYIIDVFSSETNCWKERSFMRQGDAAGTVAHLKTSHDPDTYFYHSAYWHGALYVRCEQGFALRINLSNDKYRVFKLPKGNSGTPRLGKSKKGVYCTLIHAPCTAQVWLLDESRGQIKWLLTNEINLEPSVEKYTWNHFHFERPWGLQLDYEAARLLRNEANIKFVDDNTVPLLKDDFKWDFHDQNAIDTTDWPRKHDPNARHFECFGYHPYKQIVLFFDGYGTIIAYHMDSSKVLRLGTMDPFYTDMQESFAYAPCWMRDLPGS